ncbi:MAG: substrate-binding domain-containing protein, partial [Chloroflexota bacterium]|nr:substrate-binding domain-containing protein [Chloroflexota bacterium]
MGKHLTNGSRARIAWRVPALLAGLMLVAVACTSTSSSSPGASGGTASTAGQFCKGMKIAFFPGGTSGGGFETVVYNGAKAAEAALGPTVTYQFSDWDPAKMITQFQQAVATKPDGIAIMGHPGDDAFDPLIKDAESQGILVTAMN